MNENTNSQNVSKTAYVLTSKGVITLNADDMTQDDFKEIAKQLNNIMSDIQCGKSDINSKSNGNFSFTAAPPVKKETNDDEKVASPVAFNLFDDDDDDIAKNDDNSEEELLKQKAPVLRLTSDAEPDAEDSDDKNQMLYEAGIIFPDNKDGMSITTENETDDDISDEIENYIKSSGYIDNTNLWRRWIMAQMLRHYNKADGTSGFDEYFVTGTPYYYQWKVVSSELKVLRHLKGQALADRERFFNYQIVCGMANDYKKKIANYIMKAKKHRDKRFSHVPQEDQKRCLYVTIPGYKKKIYISDSPLNTDTTKAISYKDFMDYVDKYVEKIYSNRPQDYYHLYQKVEQFMKNCPLVKTFAKSSEWKNAFKGSGAYYTMDNLIKFHNCNFHLDDGSILNTNESLAYLETKTEEYKDEYYRLYALMRKFVSDNNFAYDSIPVDNYYIPKYDG